MSLTQIDIDNLLKGPAQNRYDHFIKTALQEQKVWALYNDNWAMSGTAEGKMVFPLWPDKVFAELCASGEWANYKAVALALEEVRDNLLPQLQEKDILPGIFFTLEDGSVEVEMEELIEALQSTQ